MIPIDEPDINAELHTGSLDDLHELSRVWPVTKVADLDDCVNSHLHCCGQYDELKPTRVGVRVADE